MQLTLLTMLACGVLGAFSSLWIAASYAALVHPRHSSLLVRFATAFGTPAVRRSLVALAVMTTTALPASADTGSSDLGWGAPPPREGRSAQPVVVNPHTYTVRGGDSLWTIATNSLPPGASPGEIAAESARWFGENRDSITNPDLIFPGQILQIPQDLA
ncbi:LysM peptidoglycan-binding domain-containing protein [Ancrocorticia populi]|nr:LysM peptidoglycan-binding domain-containing protein [Ancrocorticia sp.]